MKMSFVGNVVLLVFSTKSFPQANSTLQSSSDVAGHAGHVYRKQNVLYTAKANVLMRTGLERNRALSLVADEASFVNGSVLQVFASCPISWETAAGAVLPPQLLPDLHICFSDKKVAARILEFMPAAGAEATLQRPRKGARVPTGDDLIPSWHVVIAMDHGLRHSFLREGLDQFVAEEQNEERRWILPRHLFQPNVVSLMSDQGLFKVGLHMAISMGMRAVWFYGPCHVEANLDTGVLEALNLQHMSEKVGHLLKLWRGPQKAYGRWHRRIKEAFQKFEEAYTTDEVVRRFFDGYVGLICQDLDLPAPVGDAGFAIVLDRVRMIVRKKGLDGKAVRWMNSYDSAKFVLKTRHCRLFLLDLTVLVQNCNPFAIQNIDFGDNLDDVFAKSPHSLVAGCRILRDDLMFKVVSRNLNPLITSLPFPPEQTSSPKHVLGCIETLRFRHRLGPWDMIQFALDRTCNDVM